MGLFKSFECPKCGHSFEGILDLCGRCGSRAAPLSGIRACLESGRPPGYAGGSNKPYSARSYDRALEANFAAMGITNLAHKEVNGQMVPVVTRSRAPAQYNSLPSWAGKQLPIRSYPSLEAMRRDGYSVPNLMVEGKPFEIPAVHPEVKPDMAVGTGIPDIMRRRTIFQARQP